MLWPYSYVNICKILECLQEKGKTMLKEIVDLVGISREII